MLTILFYPSVDFFTDVAVKNLLPRQQINLFVNVTRTFFMPHQQKINGGTKFVNITIEHF
jgi:hypothetical protein